MASSATVLTSARCPRATPSIARPPRCATAVLGKPTHRVRGAAAHRHACPSTGVGDRARREPGQAPRDRLRRRLRAPHPHAHDRVVAPLPAGRAVAQEHRGSCGSSSRCRAGRRCASRRRSSRRTGPGEFMPTPASPTLGPDLCRPDADIAECVARMDRFCDAEHHRRRGAARPARRVRRRQRLQVRGAVGVPSCIRSRRSARSTARAARDADRHRGQVAAGQPRPPAAGHRARRAGRGRRLRSHRKPCFRCGTPIEVAQARRAGPRHLLVPGLPAAPGASRRATNRATPRTTSCLPGGAPPGRSRTAGTTRTTTGSATPIWRPTNGGHDAEDERPGHDWDEPPSPRACCPVDVDRRRDRRPVRRRP